MSTALLQAGTEKKRGRGKAKKTTDLIVAAIAILDEIKPATVRAVCYRLFIDGHIQSMAKNNTDKVGKQLVWARENGFLSWDWIVDETREAERIALWNSPTEIISQAVKQYRKDYWATQPEWVEVWSEKGTIRGTLAPVLNKYGITFRVMHGYGSATALHGIARETERNPKSLKVLYVGDWDPSGMNMSEHDIPARLQRYNGDATIRRIALSASDVGPHTDLPSFDAASKSKDSRHKWFVERYGTRCWELDALSPVILRQRIENEVVALLDVEAWNRAVEVESAEVESMSSILTDWQSISRQAPKCSGEGVRHD